MESRALNLEIEKYWAFIRNANDEIKLNLISLLSKSLINKSGHERFGVESHDNSDELIEKFAGAWHGTETPEEIMAIIKEHSSSKQPPVFD